MASTVNSYTSLRKGQLSSSRFCSIGHVPWPWSVQAFYIRICITSNLYWRTAYRYEESKIHKIAVNKSNAVALALLETKPGRFPI